MGHYFTNEKLVSDEKIVSVNIKNISLKFYTDNGVFSKRGLDFGTRTLLESIDHVEGKILDLGCGYGPIGIYLATAFEVELDMIDINERSVNLAIKNARLNNVKNNCFVSDGYDNVNSKYDYIISNPPIRVGKEKLTSLLVEAKNHLKENGALIIVINKNQGAKSMVEFLSKFYSVNIIQKNKGFYVIKALNN
jgi:16S rRNA (guanine1207-N2)-methyltransferase